MKPAEAVDLGRASLTANERNAARLDSFFRDHSYFRMLWSNFAEVVPGMLYRSNHPTPQRLLRLARQHGLRTVINLRGEKPSGSTSLTADTARSLGLAHHYMAFESRGAPHRDRILRFHDMYRSMAKPALMHCKSGADRAGLAAGLAILFEGGTAAEARRQLSWRFGHISGSRTGILDRFFVRYAEDGEGRLPFLEWVAHAYDEAALARGGAPRAIANFVTDTVLRRE